MCRKFLILKIALCCSFLFQAHLVRAEVWQFSFGTTMGTGLAVSSNRNRTVSAPITFPLVLNPAIEVGSERVRFLTEALISYSIAEKAVNLSMWNVGARYYPWSVLYGIPGQDVVAAGTFRLFDPWVAVLGSYGEYRSSTVDRDGIVEKVRASFLGAFVNLGVDLAYPLKRPTRLRNSEWSDLVFYAEIRGGYHPLSITQPTLETSLLFFGIGCRYRF